MLSIASLIVLAQIAPSLPPPNFNFPSGKSETINIVNWDGRDLPPPVQRSEQPPVTDAELFEALKSGLDSDDIAKAIVERRCACDARLSALAKLKKAGATKDVIAAVRLHGLKPNREVNFILTVDLQGDSTEARQGTLYVFIDDGPVTRSYRANLADVVSRKFAAESMVDGADPLIPRKVRRIQLAGQIPLRRYGKHRVMVVASANPAMINPRQLMPAELRTAQYFELEYPTVSVTNQCRLNVAYRQDVALSYQWNFLGSQFECEWD